MVLVFKGTQEVARYQVGELGYGNPPALVESMDVNPRTGEVYALTIADVTRFKEGRLIDSFSWHSAKYWSKLRVHPLTGDVYITYGSNAHDGGRVMILRNMQEIKNDIVAGGGPAHLAIDPITGNVYVASFNEDTVTVIHGTEILATLKVGWYPYGIGVNPANGWVYVTNINDASVTVLGYPSDVRETPLAQPTRPVLAPTIGPQVPHQPSQVYP